ncbi:MAG TPA: DUF3467 domain-containing protein [Candidatus Desulfofervidus auxilii]|uniref:DUF3467 domain-containing protein n=1 Tax=Desulfofervidus auxilii TaxID=1621989 RepID=A0A7V0IA38_DESA2|nr:DUF3467 domain-containing protein [Candidatus Desulfofervidus auxilii]
MKAREKMKVPKFIYREEDEKIGVYSDIARIGFSAMTFSFEFAQLLPPESGTKGIPRVLVRVVMNPAHAKALLDHLADRIKAYESIYGEIKLPKEKKVKTGE